jgi:mannosylglucosylglycerate synthase
VLVVTHASGDEGGDYLAYLQEYAQLMGVRVLFIPDRVAPQRGLTADGRKVFSLADAYAQADLVTYPSAVEGFGNAFLEAVYFRRPIILRDYEIFIEDIEPKGFEVITFGDFIPSSVVEQTRQLMLNPASADAMCARNYEIARRYYAYSVLEDHLKVLMNQGLGT